MVPCASRSYSGCLPVGPARPHRMSIVDQSLSFFDIQSLSIFILQSHDITTYQVTRPRRLTTRGIGAGLGPSNAVCFCLDRPGRLTLLLHAYFHIRCSNETPFSGGLSKRVCIVRGESSTVSSSRGSMRRTLELC